MSGHLGVVQSMSSLSGDIVSCLRLGPEEVTLLCFSDAAFICTSSHGHSGQENVDIEQHGEDYAARRHHKAMNLEAARAGITQSLGSHGKADSDRKQWLMILA